MHTVLLDLPEYGFTVYSFPVLLFAALLLASWLVPRSIERLAGIDRRRARLAFLFVVLAVLVGGRIHFILDVPHVFEGRWGQVFNPWFAGYHIGGGFILGFAALALAARRLGVSLLRLSDGFIAPAGFCVALGRLGCFLQGCCTGAPCDLGWCLPYPKGSPPYLLQVDLQLISPDAPQSLHLHPLPLYFSAAGLLTGLVTTLIARRRRYDGEVALVGFVVFWGTTAYLEGLRTPWAATPYLGPLRELHWMALGLAAISTMALVAAEAAHRVRTAQRGPAEA